ncbi:ABC transporter permease [Amycolatopsis sp. NBC_01307]|uniref:ABC transporter permease n=1 Tax=Amycolatopsis sp. NBC_01307 TaxID=2903561 RepID=UPI002E1223B7|nr:ABC transporter permease [Amycolatopsis sp. NBC_01307]
MRTASRVLLRSTGVLAPLALAVVALALWELVVDLAKVPDYLLPAPSAVLASLGESAPLLLGNVQTTAVEVVGGYCLALLTAVTLGSALAYSRVFRRAAMPLVIAWKTVPTIAVAPLLVIWFGFDVLPKLLITALVCFFPITVNTADGLLSVDPGRKQLFRVLGGSGWSRFTKLDLPAALPHLLTGMKVAVPLSVIGATTSEWVGAGAGLGRLILDDLNQLDTTRVFAAILLLSLLGIVLYGLVVLLEHTTTSWQRAAFRVQPRSSRLRSPLIHRPEDRP